MKIKIINRACLLMIAVAVFASCKKNNDLKSGNDKDLQATVTQNSADAYSAQTNEEVMAANANTGLQDILYLVWYPAHLQLIIL